MGRDTQSSICKWKEPIMPMPVENVKCNGSVQRNVVQIMLHLFTNFLLRCVHATRIVWNTMNGECIVRAEEKGRGIRLEA